MGKPVVVVRRRHDLAVTPRGTIERRGVMKTKSAQRRSKSTRSLIIEKQLKIRRVVKH